MSNLASPRKKVIIIGAGPGGLASAMLLWQNPVAKSLCWKNRSSLAAAPAELVSKIFN
jgi:2-polyprenyl-6-methoxyphenol hydroxylase-like FAD-dependent oxidoreductase